MPPFCCRASCWNLSALQNTQRGSSADAVPGFPLPSRERVQARPHTPAHGGPLAGSAQICAPRRFFFSAPLRWLGEMLASPSPSSVASGLACGVAGCPAGISRVRAEGTEVSSLDVHVELPGWVMCHDRLPHLSILRLELEEESGSSWVCAMRLPQGRYIN